MKTPPEEPGSDQAQAWDKAADGWYRNAALVNTWLQEVTPAMLDAAGIGPGARVLDVAAGAGGQTLAIARRVGGSGYVLATDVAPQVVALARENVRESGLAHVEVEVADAQALGLAGAGFDAAVCRLGLMFCAEPQTALSEIASALKPGGRVAAVVFSEPQANPCVTILMSTARRHAGLPPGSPYAPGTLFSLGKPGVLAGMLEAAGFDEIKVRAIAAPLRLASSTAYMDFIRSSGSPIMAILAPLSERQRAQAWDDMQEQLDQFATDGGWCGPNELLLASARV